MEQIGGPAESALLGEDFGPVRSARVFGAVLTCPTHDNTIRWQRGERFHHLFQTRVEEMERDGTAGRLAVASDQEDLTFSALERRANQLAQYLVRQGVRPGQRIGLLLSRSPWSYVAMLAVSKAGAAYVPLDRAFPADRIQFIAEDAGISVLLTVSEIAEDFADLGLPLICLDKQASIIMAESGERFDLNRAGNDPDELCYIIYTSGSTGRPKGVAVNHSSICNFVKVAAEVYGVIPEDRVYQGMTIAFDFSVEEIWVPLFAGATLVPGPAGAALLGSDLAEFISAKQITALCCVPTLLATIDEDIPLLRFLLVSGEACPAQLVERWYKPGRVFLNVYGPTEATVTATWKHVQPGKPVTIGRPLPTYSIVVLDQEGDRLLPQGEEGEIGIAGIGLAEGYVNRPDLTAKAFVPESFSIDRNPSRRIYRTGDLGRINDEGEVEYLGRIDTQVKIRGYRIELAEIESAIMKVAGVAQAVASVHESRPGMKELVAYYTRRQDADALTQETVLEVLRGFLPSYMLPAFFEEMAALPMLPCDKVDRKRLPPPMGPRHVATRTSFVAPETADEVTLASLLGRTLGLEQVSVTDDFFDDLGANSLLMAHFCAAIRKETAFAQVSMKDLYLNRSIRALAPLLRQTGHEDVAAPREDDAHVASDLSYYACGVLQIAFMLGYGTLFFVPLLEVFFWVGKAPDLLTASLRAMAAADLLLAAAIALPIAVKWLVVGRWQAEKMPVWSPAYLRFWVVRQLVRSNPMVLFAGSPLYNTYLRLLGAKIGRHAVIQCRLPAVTDLFAVGEGALIRKSSVLNGYRVRSGYVETGSIVIGRGAFVGEATVLDIGTSVGDGAQLGHSSSLQRGQSVPAGQRYHGSPAETTRTDYCGLPSRDCGNFRRVAYTTAQLLLLLVMLPFAILLGEFLFSTFIFDLADPAAAEVSLATLGSAAIFATVMSLTALLAGLLVIYMLPKILRRFIREDGIYALYGIRHFLSESVSFLSNSVYFNVLFGDSSFIVNYLKLVGYRLDPVEQTGSNFGLAQRHDNPFLCQVGTGTLVSDGLTLINAELSSSSFRLSKASIGGCNYLGNNIFYPHNGKTGENCLLATKVMVPIDGPVRTDTGLLGSPSFEIPRTVLRDRQFAQHPKGPALTERLRRKNIANANSMGLFLLAGIVQVFIAIVLLKLAFVQYLAFGVPGLIPVVLLSPIVSMAYSVLLERMSFGFGRLEPRTCSIYDDYYWTHERYWKFSLTGRNPLLGLFAGTPCRSVILRLLGVKVGRKLFDDGCWISEKTMVEIGDHCTLAELSTLQGHSLEEGVFKSDRIRLGNGCSIGCNAFVHYGVAIGDDVILDPDSFLMKGEMPSSGSHWGGNPARQLRG